MKFRSVYVLEINKKIITQQSLVHYRQLVLKFSKLNKFASLRDW